MNPPTTVDLSVARQTSVDSGAEPPIPSTDPAIPNPRFRDYWPTVETQLRFTTQDTGNVENYLVCWHEVERLEDPLFGNLGDLPLRRWTRATALAVIRALGDKSTGEPRSLSTLTCKVNALAAVFRRAAEDRHPLTDEPIFDRPNPFRSKMTLLREAFGNHELVRRGPGDEVRPYGRDELNRLLATSRARSWSDYLALLLCVRCGLRRSEAIALRWPDFDDDARTVSIRRKASKPRNVAVRVSSQQNREFATNRPGPGRRHAGSATVESALRSGSGARREPLCAIHAAEPRTSITRAEFVPVSAASPLEDRCAGARSGRVGPTHQG